MSAAYVCMYVELETTTAPGQPTLQMLIVVGCVCYKKGPAPKGANKVHPSPNLHPIVCPPNRRIACTMFPSSHAAPATYNPLPTLASNSSLPSLRVSSSRSSSPKDVYRY